MHDYQAVFKQQQKNINSLRLSDAKQRINRLRKLKNELLLARQSIQKAFYEDFRKPAPEVDITEILPVISEINVFTKNLKKWMGPKKVATPFFYTGTTSHIYWEAKGLCLIISPWNYPLNLCLMPLIAAVAAGNAVVIKPSELNPKVNEVLAALIERIFPTEEVAFIPGDVNLAKSLLSLPFDHIFFTGSTNVGSKVMEAAAKIPCSVTLELGGKSAAIVDESADLKQAAEKIAWGKWLNAGQTCIAPDYVLIPSNLRDDFVEKLSENLKTFYQQNQKNYTAIISRGHYERLTKMRNQLKQASVPLLECTQQEENAGYFPLTLAIDPPRESDVMREEIFGPILPIISCDSFEQRVRYVNSYAKPLALYIFSKDVALQQKYRQQIPSGGALINDTILHIANHHLPFGGIGGSGQGSYHGVHGFREFSHARAIMKRRFDMGLSLFFPPYGPRVQSMLDFILMKLRHFI